VSGPLVPTGSVQPVIVAVPLQQNLSVAGAPTIAALAPETFIVRITQVTAGIVRVQWAVQTLQAAGVLQLDALDAAVSVVGEDAAGTVLVSRSDFISTAAGSPTTAAAGEDYDYTTAAPVSVWFATVTARVNRTTAVGSVYDIFAATDTAPAVS